MKLFLSLVVLLFSVNSALGCSYIGYPNPPIEYLVANTGKIFLGRVIDKSSAVQTEDDYKYRIYRVKLRVEKAIKGVAVNDIHWVRVTESINQRTSCSRDAPKFRTGEQWMVYEDFDTFSGVERFIDSPSSVDQYSKYDPKINEGYIERLEKAAENQATAVYGQIQGFRGFRSLVDADVFIEGTGIKLKTKTNKDGEYSFKNLPEGKYKIRVPVYRQTKDYFSDIKTVFDAETQTHSLEYEVSLLSGGVHYQYMVLGDEFFPIN